MNARTTDLGIPLHAVPAWEAMHEAITGTGPTPCSGRDRDDWTGTPRQQERAASRCLDCAVLPMCGAYAAAAGEPYGTWGGLTAKDRQAQAKGGAA